MVPTTKEWLDLIARQVRNLIRLPGVTPIVQDRLSAWNLQHNRRQAEIDDFDRRQHEHIERVAARRMQRGIPLYRSRQVDRQRNRRPRQIGPRGWGHVCGHVEQDGKRHRVGVWVPPELDPSNRPVHEYPFPVPNRILTLDEKYTALAAIHDARLAGQPISPWSDSDDSFASLPFAILKSQADLLRDDDDLNVAGWLDDVIVDLTAHNILKPADSLCKHVHHSPDFRSFNWHGCPNSFIDKQAAVVADQPISKSGGSVGDENQAKDNLPIARPSDKAFQAWRLRDLTGINNQTELAAKMTELGVRATQGQISRWLLQVDNYLQAGNILPSVEPLTNKPQSVDPAVLDMGKRRDGRTPKQRQQPDPDSADR